MSGKAIAVALGAVALVGGAAFMLTRGEGADERKGNGPLLPSLKSEAAGIARIELARGDERIALERSGEAWTLASSGGYPAKIDAVRGIVSGLASMTIDEPLTAKRERHAELGLAWPDASKQAMLVRLLGAGGAVLHEVVLGEEKYETKSQYARRLSEDQTYRCRGSVSADTAPRGFVDAEVVSLDAGELLSISYDGLLLNHGADGANGAWKAELAPGPAADGAWPEEQRKAAIQALPAWIGRVELENVRKREGVTWAPDPALSLTYVAKRATITIEGMKEGDAFWVRLSATPSAEAAEAPAAEPAKEGEAAKPAPAPFDWKGWNERVAAWEFRLPEWKRSAIGRIREAKPAAASGVPAPPSGLLPPSGLAPPPGG